jgi:sec-independent protein translocase protein TatA
MAVNDADQMRVYVLDAGPMPSNATPRPVLADPVPRSAAPPEEGLPARLGWLPILLLIGGILPGFMLGRLSGVHHVPARLGIEELLVLLILVVLLLGRRLADVGRYLGKGIVEYRKGLQGLEDDISPPPTLRATVRYYSRMNPQRVYPLLVLITRDLVEKVRKKHTDQRTSAPFVVDRDTPVEIEPILPGCDCHPPRIVTRLGDGDRTLTFRVVPHVLGRVDGAVVCIRQDHTSLAEVAVDMKVVKQTGVVLAGLATFLLPALSAVMKHFGLDFETQKDQGFSLYLGLARLVFDRVSPYALTALLGLATALLWWLTRPRRRDVFWDVQKAMPSFTSGAGQGGLR